MGYACIDSNTLTVLAAISGAHPDADYVAPASPSESALTPGPWKIVERGFGVEIFSADDADGKLIGQLSVFRTDAENAANAALIAAAPAMFDVLEEVERFLRPCAEDGDRAYERELLSNVRAALLRAQASPGQNDCT